MEYLFFISLGIMVHVYVLYPMALFIYRKTSKTLLKKNRKDFLKKKISDRLIKHNLKTNHPTVTIIVPCYNEEQSVLNKIQNFKSLKYPKDKIKMVFLNDQSNDLTKSILDSVTSKRIEVYHNERRKGKVQSIAEYVEKIDTELTVISDCAALMGSDAITKMNHHFHDCSVGVVGGIYEVRSSLDDSRSTGEGLYWKYEMGMRESESLIQTTTHVSGQLYLIKTNILKNITWDKDIINDDIFIPLEAIVQGYTVEVEKQAKAVENVNITSGNEFKRRRRIANGNFQTIRLLPRLFMKFHLFTIFQLFSHKYLRNLSVGFMGIIFVSNLFLIGNVFWDVMLVLQAGFYFFAFLPYIYDKKLHKLFAIPHYFLSSNLGGIVGFFDYLSTKKNYTWEKLDYTWKGE